MVRVAKPCSSTPFYEPSPLQSHHQQKKNYHIHILFQCMWQFKKVLCRTYVTKILCNIPVAIYGKHMYSTRKWVNLIGPDYRIGRRSTCFPSKIERATKISKREPKNCIFNQFPLWRQYYIKLFLFIFPNISLFCVWQCDNIFELSVCLNDHHEGIFANSTVYNGSLLFFKQFLTCESK